MTAPTHITAAIAALMLISVTLRCLEVSWSMIAFTVFSSLIPDMLDNNKSIAGFLFNRLIYAITFGRLDISRYIEHRGFFHSVPFLGLLCIILYFISPGIVPYLCVGFLSHIYLDGFQKSGVRLQGFGNYWGRFSTKWSVPLKSPSEYFILASCLLAIAISWLIISGGGTDYLVRKALGSFRATMESVRALRDYRLFLVIRDGQSEKEYEIIGCSGNEAIIFLNDNNVPLAYGVGRDCHINASGYKSYVEKGEKVRTVRYQFALKDKPLSYLYHKIDPSYSYYFSGYAILEEAVEIPRFYNRYNTISASGRRVTFSYARLEDLLIYYMEKKFIKSSDLEITYRIAGGQDASFLKAKLDAGMSEDIRRIEKRIEYLKKIISDASLPEEAKGIFDFREQEAGLCVDALKKKAKELLEVEEADLLRMRSMRKDKR